MVSAVARAAMVMTPATKGHSIFVGIGTHLGPEESGAWASVGDGYRCMGVV